MDIRNIAIIAHVDHGKTTLVDALLKQTSSFRENQKEMSESLIMDSGDLEKEKGITILAKNTSVFYKDTKINIIDTPGHADFGGEVERILNMASGALLLVDAAEGPLPQTRFVLKKALQTGLKIILVINKIDKKDARPQEVVSQVESLFLEVVEDEAALNFPIIYAVGREGTAFKNLQDYTPGAPGSLEPLFETILEVVPSSAVNEDQPFQMLISTLDYDTHLGKLCIGKVNRGVLKKSASISLVDEGKVVGSFKASKLYTSEGLNRVEVEEATSGDIIALAGIPQLTIGQTITDPTTPESLPKIYVEEPTIKVTIGANTSPVAGREGEFVNSRQIRLRPLREKETNLGLSIEEDPESASFIVGGRGELHLAVLIETMRREGFELQVSKPQVIYRTIDGVVSEPYEEVSIDVPQEHVGVITEEMSVRRANLADMSNQYDNTTRFIYKASSQNMLGIRNALLTKTRGTAVMNSSFLGYFPKVEKAEVKRNGVLIASEPGASLGYGLANAQERGLLFIGAGVNVYAGMVVGLSSRDQDIEINVCKGKKLTNMRSRGADDALTLTPPTIMSLEQALDFINDDEMLEVTPKNLRIRKRYLSALERRRASKN
ncbi:MAG: translational GTPase TypA [bacterium]|nr:translational GTPase TypA [bacterium]